MTPETLIAAAILLPLLIAAGIAAAGKFPNVRESVTIIGAFAAGIILSSTNQFDAVVEQIEPVADVFTPIFLSQSRTACAVNSEPLSLRMCSGTPRVTNSQANRSSTSSLLSDRATSIARHSRVCSSMTVSMRTQRPSCVRVCTKSYAQT